jgi:hypothetical protein
MAEDGHGIPPAADPQVDRFPVWLAGAGAETTAESVITSFSLPVLKLFLIFPYWGSYLLD